MTLNLSKRGNGDYAGATCQFTMQAKDGFKPCPHYARYEVVVADTQECFLSCRRHISAAISEVWDKGVAAVVKQVPGAWRVGWGMTGDN